MGTGNQTRSRLRRYAPAGAALTLAAALGVGAAQASAEQITLTWWWGAGPAQQAFITNDLIPRYEQAHPNVKINYVPISGSKEDKLFAAFLAGVAPDIFGGWPEERGLFPQKQMDIPLDNYLRDWSQTDDFFEGAWDSARYDGHIYGIPFYLDLRTIIYRKDFFAEAGMDNSRPPQTWNELLTAAKKLTRYDAQGSIERAGINVAPNANDFSPYLWQAGGYFVTSDLATADMSSDDALRALRFYTSLVTEHKVSPPTGVSGSWGGGFIDGHEAMVYANSAVPGRVKDSNPDLYASVGSGLPPMDKERAVMLHSDYLAISTASKHPREAFEFLKFFFAPDNLVRFSEIGSLTPPLKSLVRSEYARQNPVMLQILEAAPYGRAGRLLLDSPSFFKYSEEMLTSTLSGQVAPAQAAAIFDQQMTAALGDALKQLP